MCVIIVNTLGMECFSEKQDFFIFFVQLNLCYLCGEWMLIDNEHNNIINDDDNNNNYNRSF